MPENLAREQLAAQLRPLLPKSWRIVTTHESVDNLDVPVVKIKQKTIDRVPAAPAGRRVNVSFVVTIDASHVAQTQAAEDELDDTVLELIVALDAIGTAWTRAEKVIDDNRLAYDIDLSLTALKTKE